MSKKPRNKSRRGATILGPGHPPSLQVGALCWRRASRGVIKILLITSRDTGRWVIPKGWPMRRRSEAGAAEREAFEEAGVKGAILPRSVGLFTYRKGLSRDRAILCVVQVFPLEVMEMLRKYPETGQRKVKWFSRAKAAHKVAEPELAAIIRGFDPDQAAAEEK
jgi:8-oxo-dGTP pyrophosphatase MutT (NUDIX family)